MDHPIRDTTENRAGVTTKRLGWRVACALLALVSSVRAQSEMESLFGPPIFRPTGSGRLHVMHFGDRGVEPGEDDLGLTLADLQLNYAQPVGPGRAISMGAEFACYRFSTEALLPNRSQPLPETILDIGASFGYRHSTLSGRSWALSTGVSSPSDEPFHSLDETIISATALYRIGWRQRHHLSLLLNYSNQRSFLNHWPLPGIAYDYRPDRNVFILVGVPVLMCRIRFAEVWETDMFYFPPIRGHLQLSRRLPIHLNAFVRIQSIQEAFLLADREDADSWLRHEYYQGELGCRWSRRLFSVTGSIGYAFERELYLSDSFSDSGGGSLAIDNGVTGQLRIACRF